MPIIIIGGTVLLSKYFFIPWYVTDIISYLRYSHYRRFCVILIHIFNYSYLFRNSFLKKGGVLTAITKNTHIEIFLTNQDQWFEWNAWGKFFVCFAIFLDFQSKHLLHLLLLFWHSMCLSWGYLRAAFNYASVSPIIKFKLFDFSCLWFIIHYIKFAESNVTKQTVV